MTQEDFKELIAVLASYAVEHEMDDYPYRTAPNGDVHYTDAAQERFNHHHDTLEQIVGCYFDVGQNVTVEDVKQ